MNPFWQADLLGALQSAVHTASNSVGAAPHAIHATVRFTVVNGTVRNPEVVVSTGDAELDAMLLRQVAAAAIPKPIGLETEEAHDFEMPLQMFTPLESTRYRIYRAINGRKVYDRDAILRGDTGITVVNFDYRGGKLTDILIAKSSGHSDLDRTSIAAVSTAVLPSADSGYTGEILHMQAVFCYELNSAEKCPSGNNVIEVKGTRIIRFMSPAPG